MFVHVVAASKRSVVSISLDASGVPSFRSSAFQGFETETACRFGEHRGASNTIRTFTTIGAALTRN
jgi:hypothetical protein